MIKVFLDTTALESGHAHRGIGSYTRNLKEALSKDKDIKLVSSKEQADLIHYPFFDFFQATLPLTKTKPTIVTIHDVIPLQFPKYYPRGIKGQLKLWYQKSALKSVAAIITDSKSSQEQIVDKLGIAETNISVVPLAASKELSYVSKDIQKRVAKKYDLPKQFVLYVGDINYNKNIPGLLKSLSQVKSDILLVCVGKNFKPQNIPEWQRISDTIKKHNLKDKVLFLTNVDTTQDLAGIYSQAIGYIQPSLAEGFGLPILEAMQCYTPVITYKKSAMAEVGGNYAIYPEAVENRTLAETIDELVALDDHSQKKIVLPAYSWSQTFSWKKVAEQTIAVYKKVIDKNDH